MPDSALDADSLGCRRASCLGVRRRVSKAVEDGRKSHILRGGHPRNGRKAVSGVVHPQGVEGSGMAGLGETFGSPWIPLAIRACLKL
jgi:hypothetical protein